MAEDRVGNPIKEGDLVMIKMNTDHIIGRVSKLSDPRVQLIRGTMKGPSQEVHPGIVSLVIEYDHLFLPEQRIVDIVRVVDPVPPGAFDKTSNA